jgi:hypothetical protein
MSQQDDRKKTPQKFHCPFCQKCIWRLGSAKYYCLLFSGERVRINYNCWLEEFYCEEHGKLWMRITKKSERKLVVAFRTEQLYA